LQDKSFTTRKGISSATIRGIMVIRHYQGIDVLDKYRDAINQNYHKLPKAWVGWSNRVRGMSTSVNKDADFRKMIGAMTWQVTDPGKNLDEMIVIKNLDSWTRKISEEVEYVLFKSIGTK